MNPAQSFKVVNSTPPAAIVDNASFTVAELDTQGYDYATVMVILGATDIAMTALAVTESDTAGAGHANVTGLVYGTSTDIDGSTSALPSATDDDGVFSFEIDLRGRKRYLDVTATAGDGATGTYATIVSILWRGDEQKQDASSRGFASVLRV